MKTTNIVKEIFIFPTEDIQKQITPNRERVLTLQKPVRILKNKISEYKFQIDFRKSHQIS